MYQKVLFTHDDLDGAGCRVIFDVVYGTNHIKGQDYQIYNCSNDNVNDVVRTAVSRDEVTGKTLVFFGDIVCNRETLNWLQNKVGATVVILDHHRTNFWAEHEVQFPGICTIVPENRLGVMQSGTSLMYQYFSRELPLTHRFNSTKLNKCIGEFVDVVRSYDTFEFKTIPNELAQKMMILFQMLGMDKFSDMYVDRYLGEEFEGDLIPQMAMFFIDAKLDNEQKSIDKFTRDDVVMTEIRGYKTAVLMKVAGARISELSYQFLQKNPDIDIMASFSLVEGGGLQFRTVKDDINTGELIAKPIGGGGHPKASGAPLNAITREAIADIVINYIQGFQPEEINYDELKGVNNDG